ncbi:hypothetical protein GCK72_004812 [Caenorhabditis remanei]|uniref:PDZ domain-containing protein n=1 Tax=Caenorhabditis remanei TaxID=31234 RepID=A0A6A5HF58_CAERE|nr:hypothetical protein GCK72_004812 [Caenorhabditis remanei]KAF1764862.1 hypothetical protein GCK72_004812 [Caenorhabditis remanei]
MSASKLVRSPKYKLKKKASNTENLQNSEQRSENCTLDEAEAADEKEEKTVSIRKAVSIRKTVSSKAIVQVPVPEAPPTHFLPVVIQIDATTWSKFMEHVDINRNLLITFVRRPLMSSFMPGDQITIVDGSPFWTLESLKDYIGDTLLRGRPTVAITVIRAWNLSCLSKEQIDKIAPLPEEKLHYFSVKIYCQNEDAGLMLCSDRKRVLVQHLRAKTPASHVFLVGDQILGVNEEIYETKDKRPLRKQIKKQIEQSAKKNGFAEIIACRQIGARSSPAPSLEAELAEKFPEYAIGVEKGINVEKKISLPLEADALEISMRELTWLKCYEGRDGFEIPICDRGEDMDLPFTQEEEIEQMELPGLPPQTSSTNVTPSSSITQLAEPAPVPLAKSGSNTSTLPTTTISEKVIDPAKQETSKLEPPVVKTENEKSVVGKVENKENPENKENVEKTDKELENSMDCLPIADTPRKRSIFKKEAEPGDRTVTIKDIPETNKITSDIPEEDEMKKCDARSGMIAYIKNIFK